MLTIGVPMGAALIIGSWLLTGYYVSKANKDSTASATSWSRR